MDKKEIPSQDPELEPGETPASAETEWLLKELSGGDDSRAEQRRLSDSGISIIKGPDPAKHESGAGEQAQEYTDTQVLEMVESNREALGALFSTLEEQRTHIESALENSGLQPNQIPEIQEQVRDMRCKLDIISGGLQAMETIRDLVASASRAAAGIGELHSIAGRTLLIIMNEIREEVRRKKSDNATAYAIHFGRLVLDVQNVRDRLSDDNRY